MPTMVHPEVPSHLRRRFAAAGNRRQFLQTLGLGGLFFTIPGAFAQELVLTPEQTLGPYYPDQLPLDQDNDLLYIHDRLTPAVGEIVWISGRVLDRRGDPVRGALVEIWQADINGAYIHSQSTIRNRDAGFQGYGRFLTGSNGAYVFRTIKPGQYPGRTRHVHYAVTPPGQSRLVTQLYISGESSNATDGVLNGIRDAAQRDSVIVPWTAIEGSRVGELAARFDIVLGYTPTENSTPTRPTLVAVNGVVNAASLQPGVAPGAWVTLFGQGLSASTRTWTAADLTGGLPQSLDSVSVQIDNRPTAVHYISPTQLNVQAPSGVGTGPVQVTVTTAAGTSDAVSVDAASLMPAFFLVEQDYVAAVRPDGSYVAPEGLLSGVSTQAARPGESVILFGTGFGATNPEVAPGANFSGAAPLAGRIRVRVDHVETSLAFAGLISPGLYQFNLTVPDLPDGDHSVTADIDGVYTGKIGRLRIQQEVIAALAGSAASLLTPAQAASALRTLRAA